MKHLDTGIAGAVVWGIIVVAVILACMGRLSDTVDHFIGPEIETQEAVE